MSTREFVLRSLKIAAVMAVIFVIGCALYRGSINPDIWGTDR